MFIKKAVHHFIDFHQGAINIIAHIIGFCGIFYSLYSLHWLLFAVSLAIVESGHMYNHFAGIRKYDFRVHVTFWRMAIFALVVLAFSIISQAL